MGFWSGGGRVGRASPGSSARRNRLPRTSASATGKPPGAELLFAGRTRRLRSTRVTEATTISRRTLRRRARRLSCAPVADGGADRTRGDDTRHGDALLFAALRPGCGADAVWTSGGAQADSRAMLLRVFFSVHGNKVVLLLGGYDKGRHPAKSHQQSQIRLARERLAAWKRRQESA